MINPFRSQASAMRLSREELAASLARVGSDISSPRSPGARVAPSRAQAHRARPDLDALVRRLADPRPVAERGLTLTRRLLSDGSGPLYWRDSREDLRARLREALAALEPNQPSGAVEVSR